MADPYASPTDDELSEADHAFRPDLYAGQVVLVTGGAGGIGRLIRGLIGGKQRTQGAAKANPSALVQLSDGIFATAEFGCDALPRLATVVAQHHDSALVVRQFGDVCIQ